MPTPPITPATFNEHVPDPSTESEGKVRRARRVARRARELIEQHGWTQNQSISFNGERCLSQAISEARTSVRSKRGLAPLTGHKMSAVITGILEEARPKVTRRAPAFTHLSSVVDWNDKRGRTREQVLALLSAAEEG